MREREVPKPSRWDYAFAAVVIAWKVLWAALLLALTAWECWRAFNPPGGNP